MTDPSHALVLDLVEWLAPAPKPYDEVMAAWRTSCPRLSIWEDASAQGLVACERPSASVTMVRATPKGLALLEREGRLSA